MKKIKILLTTFALLAGIFSVFTNRINRYSGTVYWEDVNGHKYFGNAIPDICIGGNTLCAVAFNAQNQLTGSTAQFPP